MDTPSSPCEVQLCSRLMSEASSRQGSVKGTQDGLMAMTMTLSSTPLAQIVLLLLLGKALLFSRRNCNM